MSKKVIILIVLTIMILSFALVGCSMNKTVVDDNDNKLDWLDQGILETSDVISDGIRLATTSGVSSDGYPIQTITAYVTPNEQDIEVGWSVDWKTNAQNIGKSVSEFITISPSSNSCEIKCIKPFGTDTINVTAEAGIIKRSASCTVSFVGKAQAINVTSNEYTQGDIYLIEKGKNGTFSFSLSNVFNSVTSDVSVTLGAVGELYFYTQVSTYQNTTYSNVRKENLNDVVDRFAQVSLSNNVVTVQAKDVIKFYDGTKTVDTKGTPDTRDDVITHTNRYLSGGGYNNQYAAESEFNSANVGNCYIRVTISDRISGITKILKIRIEPYIYINMSLDNISF